MLTLEFEKFYFVTVYTPNSKPDLARLEYRMRWDRAFTEFMVELETQKPVIFCGDLNVAHNDIDLRNPKENRRNAGFTDEERDGLRAMLERKYIDTFRHLYPDTEFAYSWWSNFFQARARNIGWRIDYHLVSNSLAPFITHAFIHPEVLGSDHCPVGIILEGELV